jgi:Tol biopolymer transport system component
MKRMSSRLAWLVVGVAVATMEGAAAPQKAETAAYLMEAAKQKANVEGDLQGAIRQAQTLIDRYEKTDRSATAQALLAMAEWYQRLGNPRAQRINERIVSEFQDQQRESAIARERLGIAAAAQAGVATRVLWAGAGVDIQGAVSPDGRSLSFVDYPAGDLAIRDLATGTNRRLDKGTLENGGDYAGASRISRDGTQVAYFWYDAAKGHPSLRVTRLDGSSSPRTVFDNSDRGWLTPYDWSPDGRTLAVSLTGPDRSVQIGLLTLEGTLKMLKPLDWRGPAAIMFSPDGKSLAYDHAVGNSRQRDVFVMRIDGSGDTAVAPDRAYDAAVGWSPDGRALLFVSDRSQAFVLWSQPMAGGQPAGAPVALRQNVGALMSLGVTRAGALVYGVQTGGAEIYTAALDFETGQVVMPPSKATDTSFFRKSWPDWSLDGTRLTYLSTRQGTLVISVLNVDTRALTEVLPAMRIFQRPRWSPSGAITIQGTDLQGRQGLHTVDLQTGNVTPLALDDARQVSWSRDGRYVVYRRVRGGEGDLIVQDVSTRQERVVAHAKVGFFAPNLSPNGQQVAYISRDLDKKVSAVKVMPIGGGEARTVFETADSDGLGNITQWTPDGRRLVYWSANSFWSIPVAGGTPVRLRLAFTGDPARFHIHPDGRRVAFSEGTDSYEVSILEKFLPATTAGK